MSAFTPKAFVKTTCPYSFKFRLFVTEAQIAERFEFVPMDPESENFASLKDDIQTRSGQPVHFPTVETEPGKFMNDSDALIAHYAREFEIDTQALATLSFYRNGLFPTFLELVKLCSGPLPWLIRLGRVPRAFR